MGSPNRLLVLLLPFFGSLTYASSERDALEALVERDAEPKYKPYISTIAEYNTECKKCPRSLCPNTKYYGYDDGFNVTCWTRGTKIMDDNLWLRSSEGCYVTQYDVIEYDGDYTKDLAYCGKKSEAAPLNAEENTIKFKAECRITPYITADIVSYLPENTDVMLLCWSDEGQVVIDDPYWLKTTQNCYVSRKHLEYSPTLDFLGNCGPIPDLEWANHHNENGTTDINKRDALPVPEEAGTQYLINVTVGEEYAYCRTCPDEKCKAKRRYKFNQEIYLQCLAQGPSDTNVTTWWSETTDFCYVKNSDLWEYPEGDYYRFPLCEYFETPGDDEHEEDDDDDDKKSS